jgi:hypothetical protein
VTLAVNLPTIDRDERGIRMSMFGTSKVSGSTGQTRLASMFDLKCPAPHVSSVCGPGVRNTTVLSGRTIEKYPASYAPEDTFAGHLRFALRYEPLDMGILAGAFAACEPSDIAGWVSSEPKSAYARRAWFLYEWFTGNKLDLPDLGSGTAYVSALDEELNVGAPGVQSRRHKVVDNMFGVPSFCPTIRATKAVKDFASSDIDVRARSMVSDCDPRVLARAVNYLYTKETRSTFEIEREQPTGQRAERFVAALKATSDFDPSDPQHLVSLQNMIVDPKFAASGFRDFQNFVGQTGPDHRQIVDFICPRPDELPDLMRGWMDMTARIKGSGDIVAEAAAVAFAFVFLHPFDDGNGRIHRFLVHHVLQQEGFTPDGVLFPVSAAIVRDMRGYDVALENFSKTIQPHIDWKWTPTKAIEVSNDTSALYRYFDATAQVEFLHAKIAETVDVDLKDELAYVARFDAALKAVNEIVDLPGRRASLLTTYIVGNEGKLAKRKRSQFEELDDRTIAAIEEAIEEATTPESDATNDAPAP